MEEAIESGGYACGIDPKERQPERSLVLWPQTRIDRLRRSYAEGRYVARLP